MKFRHSSGVHFPTDIPPDLRNQINGLFSDPGKILIAAPVKRWTTVTEETPEWRGEAVEDALARFLPIHSDGMKQSDIGKAEAMYRELFTLSADAMNKEDFGRSIGDRIGKAKGLAPGGRRKMLEEDSLALEVEKLDLQIREPALRSLRGGVGATADVKREVRRASARLGRLNAVLVGRFPHLTHLLEKISEACLDALFVLADGNSPLSARLAKAKTEMESRKADG